MREAVAQAYDAAGAVFTGRVVGARNVTLAEAQAGAEQLNVYVDVVVERGWKGAVPRDTVMVTTFGQPGMCGADLRPGRRYLIYADRNAAEELTTSSCSRTAHLRVVQRAELRVLDRLRRSTAGGRTPRPEPRRCG
jgi:hypothetical protein